MGPLTIIAGVSAILHRALAAPSATIAVAQFAEQAQSNGAQSRTAYAKADTLPRADGQVLVEVRIGIFASRAMVVRVDAGGAPSVPLTKILTLAEIKFRRNGTRVESARSRGAAGFVLDPERGRMGVGRERWTVGQSEVTQDSEGIWVNLAMLERILGVPVVYDASSADLEIRNAEGLPVGQRINREAAVSAQRRVLQQRKFRPMDAVTAELDDADAMRRAVVVDYQLSHHRNFLSTSVVRGAANSRDDVALDIGAAMPLARGVLNVRSLNSRSEAQQSAWWNWSSNAGGRVNQLTLGALESRGLQPTSMFGVLVSNAVARPDAEFGSADYAIDLPGEWRVDAFRGLTLVSEARTNNGTHSLSVPLTNGTNVFEIVALGPSGERRTFERSFHTPNILVRPGSFEYAISGGACANTRVCRAALNADTRFAMSDRLAVRTGADAFVSASARTLSSVALAKLPDASMYAELSTVVTRSLVADVSMQTAMAGAQASRLLVRMKYEPTPYTILNADYSNLIQTFERRFSMLAADDTNGLSAMQRTRSNRFGAYAHHALAATQHRVSLEGWGSIQTWGTTMLSNVRAGFALQSNHLNVRPYIRMESQSFSVLADLAPGERGAARQIASGAQGLDVTLVPARNGSLGAWWIRSNLEVASGRLSSWSAAVARSLGKWRLDATMAQSAARGGQAFTLSVMSELPHLNISSALSSTHAERTTALTRAQGSVVYDRDLQRISLSAQPSTGRAGLAGVVFLDENGDGIRQRSESPIPEAMLYVNNMSVRADKRGRYLLWGLPAQSVHQVVLDTSSLANPLWMPLEASWTVRARAGAFASADIAVVATGIVHGVVEVAHDTLVESSRIAKGDSATVTRGLHRPVRLMLRSRRNGAVRYIDSFSDGTFHEEGIVPAEYEISVDSASLAGMSLRSVPLRFSVSGFESKPGQVAPSGGSLRVLLVRADGARR